MSEHAKTEVESLPGHRYAHWKWQRGLRWFLGEFLVVVVGILVALALNSWWEDRQAAEREQVYLKQLRSDLLDTETRLGKLVELSQAQSLAAAHVTQAFWRSTPPDKAAFLKDLDDASFIYGEAPTMGSINAVAKSGHLDLVHDPTLRAHILEYADRNEGDMQGALFFLNQYFARGMEALSRSSVDLIAVRDDGSEPDTSRAYPSGPRKAPYPLDMDIILHDRDVYVAYRYFFMTHSIEAKINLGVIGRAKELRAEVEKHIRQ